MSTAMLRRVGVVVWSVVVWCALWSDLSIANVLWGAVAGALSIVLIPLHRPRRPIRLRPLGIVRYVLYSAWALVKSSAIVAWTVLSPSARVNPGIVSVPLRVESVAVATLVANTVSLTPGTLTLEIRHDPLTLYVHVMHLRSVEDTRREIGELEEYAMRAFPEVDQATASEEAS